MASAGKAKKREEAKDVVLVRTHDADLIVRDEADAIGELLGKPAAPTSRSRLRPSWRQMRWALVVVPLLGLAAPVFLWFQYQSQYVISKNAAVRGHVAEIGTRLNGRVSTVAVDVGDRVEAGQVLVQLENLHLTAQVEEARAKVASLERTIEVERVTVDLERGELQLQGVEATARVAAAEAQVEAARIETEDARRNHELQETLYSQHGAVSSQVVRDAESRLRTAEARLAEARANAVVAVQSVDQGVRLAEDALTIRGQNIGVLEADLLSAQARLTRAEADLEGAAIRAPEDGAIVRRIIQPGGAVRVGQPIISMRLGDEIWVEAWIDEEDLGFVRLDSKVTVTFQSFPGRKFTGVVDKIGLATDLVIPDFEVPQPRGSRMSGAPVVGVRIRLHQPPGNLLPGLSAVVAIERKE